MESRWNIFTWIIAALAFVVPILVLPMILDNAFNTPKTVLMLIGVCTMAGIYVCRLLLGREILVSKASTIKIMLVLVLLNFFSLFYTENPYYTIHAAMFNLCALSLLYFVSLYVTSAGAFLVLAAVALSGVLVSIETYLQFCNIFLIFKWANPGIMVMGTIGNSNYLGAYLIFPLFALAGLVFLLKGKLRFIPIVLFVFVFGALLFTRARAGWLGFFIGIPVFLLLLKKIYGIQLISFVRSHAVQTASCSVVCLSVLLSLWFIAPQRLHDMMGFKNVTDSLTLKLRMKKYSQASLWLFKQNPLFGTGLWSYRNMVFEAQARIHKDVDPNFFKDYPEPKPESVHNEYLEVLNDGGLVAASVIVIFLTLLFHHGWKVIDNVKLERKVRVMAASTFSAVIAILLAAFFFFPFRINSTLFMTALMMGLTEGFYLRSAGLISGFRSPRSDAKALLIPVAILILCGMVWYQGIRPFESEAEHFKYKRVLAQGNAAKAERYLLNAIDWDPHNTVYNFYAAQFYMSLLRDFGKASDFIEKATYDYNGDIIRWSLFFVKGLLKFQSGNLFEARAAFEKSLYYNPEYSDAKHKLDEVNKVIKDHDSVMIKFR